MTPYYDTFNLIERLHRHFLDVLKVELDRAGVRDVNSVQALILYNIGDDELTVGELTLRGYYLGSNVSYNVKKLVENDYLVQERSIHDRRSIRVRLTEKGQDLRDRLEAMFQRQEAVLSDHGIDDDNLRDVNATMVKLERFWSSQLDFGAFLGTAKVA